jgi:ATP-binding cassette subfamily F protein uup
VTHDRWLLNRVSTILLALDGTGRVDWFADYAQWEAAQERNASDGSPDDGNGDATEHIKQARRPKKLSYREQREWGTIEEDILKAEAHVAGCEAAMNDPAVLSDAAGLQAHSEALVAAQAEVERLYARWAVLDQKRMEMAKL